MSMGLQWFSHLIASCIWNLWNIDLTVLSLGVFIWRMKSTNILKGFVLQIKWDHKSWINAGLWPLGAYINWWKPQHKVISRSWKGHRMLQQYREKRGRVIWAWSGKVNGRGGIKPLEEGVKVHQVKLRAKDKGEKSGYVQRRENSSLQQSCFLKTDLLTIMELK